MPIWYSCPPTTCIVPGRKFDDKVEKFVTDVPCPKAQMNALLAPVSLFSTETVATPVVGAAQLYHMVGAFARVPTASYWSGMRPIV